MTVRLSILDLAPIARGETASDSFAASVALAQQAEELGYERVWYAEHHNMPSIASSATSVLIAHVGAQTQTIRLGAGGVMLPNHAPLTIAEQFGTLAAMYPGRIDLGLGRAPGSDQNTMYALRRDPRSAEAFPQDVVELRGYLAGDSVVPGVDAVMIGPNDLSLSLGVFTQWDSPKFKDAIAKIRDSCIRNGVAPGIVAINDVEKRLEEGFRFFQVTQDTMLLSNYGAEVLGRCRALSP